MARSSTAALALSDVNVHSSQPSLNHRGAAAGHVLTAFEPTGKLAHRAFEGVDPRALDREGAVGLLAQHTLVVDRQRLRNVVILVPLGQLDGLRTECAGVQAIRSSRTACRTRARTLVSGLNDPEMVNRRTGESGMSPASSK